MNGAALMCTLMALKRVIDTDKISSDQLFPRESAYSASAFGNSASSLSEKGLHLELIGIE
jgi:hypothetical protein